MDESQARKDLIEVCRLSYQRGYICGKEGNFSIRLSENLLLSTPRDTCKARLEPADLVLTDMKGIETHPAQAGSRGSRASTELPMHLTAYAMRPDVKAVVHAHPTVAVGFSVAGLSLAKCVLPEVVCTLGVIPTAAYATPSTQEVSSSIASLIAEHDALILDHHGALAVGNDIWDAFYKLETLEHHAQTMMVAHLLGGVQPLYASQVRKLLDIRSVYGLTKPLPVEKLAAGPCSRPDPEGKS